jgi:hypothetical protein
MWDSLRIASWVGVAAFVLGAGCLAYIVAQNSASRNIALAAGALAGAALLLTVQLIFELQPGESSDFVTAEFTLDRAKPEIRQWKYITDQGSRMMYELTAGAKFAAAHPGQFDGDRTKLTHDMVIFSLLSYIAAEQFDWQIKRTQFLSQTATQTLMMPGSRPHECTMITTDEIRTKLLNAGNSFADAGTSLRSLCLPPRSALQVAADGVTLLNPFCEISFVLEPSGGISYTQPFTHGLTHPKLPNGESALETRATNIRVTTRYSRMRAQHRDMPKYQDWSKRLVSGAQNWFMGDLLTDPVLKALQEFKDDNDKVQGQMEQLQREIATLKESPAKNGDH